MECLDYATKMKKAKDNKKVFKSERRPEFEG
jgi:hypothetical protein